jgi:transposase
MEDTQMARSLVDDELWALVEPLLPRWKPSPKGGQPRKGDRLCLTGIIFVLRTGIGWEHFPQEMGCCGMTLWNRLAEWQSAGVWARIHRVLLARLNGADLIDWSRAAVDSGTIRAVGGANKPAPIRRTAASPAANIISSRMATAFPWRPFSRRPTAMTSRN